MVGNEINSFFSTARIDGNLHNGERDNGVERCRLIDRTTAGIGTFIIFSEGDKFESAGINRATNARNAGRKLRTMRRRIASTSFDRLEPNLA